MKTVTIRRVTAVTTGLVAVAAAIMSYSGLYELARIAGYPAPVAALFPLAVDGLGLAGLLALLHAAATAQSRVFGWFISLTAVGVSIYGNAAVATDVQAKVVHAIAPIFLILSVEALVRLIHTKDVEAVEVVAENEVAAESLPVVATQTKPTSIKAAQKSSQPAQAAARRPASTRPKLMDAERAEALKKAAILRENGASLRAIEAEVGINKTALSKHFRELAA